MEGCTYFCSYQRSAPGRECPSGLASSPGRDWFAGLTSMYPGVGREPGRSRAGAGREPGTYFTSPVPGLQGLKFYWPGVGQEPGRLRYIAWDLKNPGYLGCSAYLNYIGGNMQYLPINFTKAMYL